MSETKSVTPGRPVLHMITYKERRGRGDVEDPNDGGFRHPDIQRGWDFMGIDSERKSICFGTHDYLWTPVPVSLMVGLKLQSLMGTILGKEDHEVAQKCKILHATCGAGGSTIGIGCCFQNVTAGDFSVVQLDACRQNMETLNLSKRVSVEKKHCNVMKRENADFDAIIMETFWNLGTLPQESPRNVFFSSKDEYNQNMLTEQYDGDRVDIFDVVIRLFQRNPHLKVACMLVPLTFDAVSFEEKFFGGHRLRPTFMLISEKENFPYILPKHFVRTLTEKGKLVTSSYMAASGIRRFKKCSNPDMWIFVTRNDHPKITPDSEKPLRFRTRMGAMLDAENQVSRVVLSTRGGPKTSKKSEEELRRGKLEAEERQREKVRENEQEKRKEKEWEEDLQKRKIQFDERAQEKIRRAVEEMRRTHTERVEDRKGAGENTGGEDWEKEEDIPTRKVEYDEEEEGSDAAFERKIQKFERTEKKKSAEEWQLFVKSEKEKRKQIVEEERRVLEKKKKLEKKLKSKKQEFDEKKRQEISDAVDEMKRKHAEGVVEKRKKSSEASEHHSNDEESHLKEIAAFKKAQKQKAEEEWVEEQRRIEKETSDDDDDTSDEEEEKNGGKPKKARDVVKSEKKEEKKRKNTSQVTKGLSKRKQQEKAQKELEEESKRAAERAARDAKKKERTDLIKKNTIKNIGERAKKRSSRSDDPPEENENDIFSRQSGPRIEWVNNGKDSSGNELPATVLFRGTGGNRNKDEYNKERDVLDALRNVQDAETLEGFTQYYEDGSEFWMDAFGNEYFWDANEEKKYRCTHDGRFDVEDTGHGEWIEIGKYEKYEDEGKWKGKQKNHSKQQHDQRNRGGESGRGEGYYSSHPSHPSGGDGDGDDGDYGYDGGGGGGGGGNRRYEAGGNSRKQTVPKPHNLPSRKSEESQKHKPEEKKSSQPADPTRNQQNPWKVPNEAKGNDWADADSDEEMDYSLPLGARKRFCLFICGGISYIV